jgi:hypothetical protein
VGTILKGFVISIILSIQIAAQGMWHEYSLDNYSYSFGKNKTLQELKDIIINDNVDSSPTNYSSAAKYLFYEYRNTESQFLLENLKITLDSTLSFPQRYSQFDKLYTVAFIRGLLGDKDGISMMTTIAESGLRYSLEAIRRLAEAGIYNYYSEVKEKYLQNEKNGAYLYSLYGNDKRYYDEVRSSLEEKARAQTNYIDIAYWANYIANFDHDLYIKIFDDHFERSTGKEKYDTFFHLGCIDRDRQPERTIFGLINEPNDSLRAEYIPFPSSILESNLGTYRYLEPAFVNSLQKISIDTSSWTYRIKRNFIRELKPYPPDNSSTILQMLDKLTYYIDECEKYRWIGENEFAIKLLGFLTKARKYLITSNSAMYKNELVSFQKTVDDVYNKVRGDDFFLTIEGYRFLFHYSQYILDSAEPQNTFVSIPHNLLSNLHGLLSAIHRAVFLFLLQ